MQLETSFPDLPFTNHGDMSLKPSGTHSFAGSTPRASPRTDLQTLRAWETFPDDVHCAIQSATDSTHLSSTSFHISAWTGPTFVANEERIRGCAMFMLHQPVEEVLEKLGINGEFESPASRNRAIVGSPDFSWIVSVGQPHPKLIVRVPATISFLVKPCWCRLNTRLGGRQICRTLLLLLMALIATPSVEVPCTLSSRSTAI
jgi:hypothetical protein